MTFACVFPGQGSQSVGMLSQLLTSESTVRSTFDEASSILGYDLCDLVLNGPEETLNATDHTQPAMLVTGVSLWRLWCTRSQSRPEIMAGHSLGEYTALVCAGVLEFAQAVRLVEVRGQAMQAAVPVGVGAMAAIIGLDDEGVVQACDQAQASDKQGSEVVEAVNYNAPGQVVIAGNKAAVERAIEIAKQSGARKAIPLPVSVPSHCALMMPAAQVLRDSLDRISLSPPTIPVLHNADVAHYVEPEAIKAALVKQVHQPVRWVETITAMADRGVTHIVELGPGKVLAGLNRRINRSMGVKPVFDHTTLSDAIADLEDRQ